MERYNIVDTGPDGIYNMENDPTQKEVRETNASIRKRLRAEPEMNFLIIQILAGHGMIDQGREILLLNEFDEDCKFYKFRHFEQTIRDRARTFTNSYQIAIFACCRQIFDENIHSGGISKKEAQKLDSPETGLRYLST